MKLLAFLMSLGLYFGLVWEYDGTWGNPLADTKYLHDGEHDDVEGGVGAVQHLPPHPGGQGPHLLVNVLENIKI